MKKFAAMLMLVSSLGVFAVVGCGTDAKTSKDTKTTTETKSTETKTPAKPADKMTTETKTTDKTK